MVLSVCSPEGIPGRTGEQGDVSRRVETSHGRRVKDEGTLWGADTRFGTSRSKFQSVPYRTRVPEYGPGVPRSGVGPLGNVWSSSLHDKP